MKKIVTVLMLVFLIASLTVSAHEEITEEIYENLKSLEGQQVPSNFKSSLGNENIDAQLLHEDGSVSYFTVITKNGKIEDVQQEMSSSPTVRVTVKESVLIDLDENKENSEAQKQIIKDAVKNKDITVKGVGWKRGLRFGFYKIAARFL